MENWDLQAIVKGCNRPNSTATKLMEDPFLSSFLREDESSSVYPQVFESKGSSSCSHELEGFGSWIYPVLHPLIPHPQNSAIISELFRDFKEPEKLLLKKKQIAANKQKQTSKKSRQNRVVKEVKADGVCSDSWGWRKYGQKPIKGSPYPRSYYRCSSSKGCSARKQVERSLSDPNVFIVTYTAEHNHAEPTRRNALAGTTRKKLPIPENSSFDMLLSPNNSSTSGASIEEEQPMLMEGVVEGEVLMNMPFEFYSQDLFSGLEDLLFG